VAGPGLAWRDSHDEIVAAPVGARSRPLRYSLSPLRASPPPRRTTPSAPARLTPPTPPLRSPPENRSPRPSPPHPPPTTATRPPPAAFRPPPPPAPRAQIAERGVLPRVAHGRKDPHPTAPRLQQHLLHRLHRQEVALQREGPVGEVREPPARLVTVEVKPVRA